MVLDVMSRVIFTMGFETFLLRLLRDLGSTYLIPTSSISVHVGESVPNMVFVCVCARHVRCVYSSVPVLPP